MSNRDLASRRARRLVRWYPRSWRERYAEEFVELLIAEIGERPRSPRRTLDVVRSGLLARLAAAGLAGPELAPGNQVRASLAALGCCSAVFLAFGGSLWAQLTIGWQWSAPDTPSLELAMAAMSGALLALVVLAVLCAAPVLWSAGSSVLRPDGARLRTPLLVSALGLTALVLGGAHFDHGWPGTGGHSWAEKGLVPGGLASFAWAATLSISAYWAHPHELGTFPAVEIAWMICAPVAIAATVTGAAQTVRRLQLSPRVLRHEAQLARLGTGAMLVFLAGGVCRVFAADTGPRNLFAYGTIDVLEVVVMSAALLTAFSASRRLRRAAAAV